MTSVSRGMHCRKVMTYKDKCLLFTAVRISSWTCLIVYFGMVDVE